MSKSFLQSIVREMSDNDEQAEFIENISTSTGLDQNIINEVYVNGLKEAKNMDKSPHLWAKSKVYSYLHEVEGVVDNRVNPRTKRHLDRKERFAQHLAKKALERGQKASDLERQARLSDKLGEPDTDAKFRAAELLKKNDSKMGN